MPSLSISKKSISKRNHKKRNVTFNESLSIANLTERIPREVDVISTSDLSEADFLIITDALARFIRYKDKTTYNQMIFNEKQTLHEVLILLYNYSLSRRFFEGLFYNSKKKEVHFLYQIDYREQFFVFELKYLNSIHNEALKIGYAHFLKNFNSYIENSIIGSNAKEYNIFSPYVEMYETDEEDDQDVSIMLKNHKFKLENAWNLYDNYITKELDIFLKFKPKNKEEKVLYSSLKRLLQMDFDSIFKALPLLPFDNESIRLDQLFFIIEDLNEKIQDEYISGEDQNVMEYCLNSPCSSIIIKSQKIYNNSESQEHDFKEALNELETLIYTLKNYY